MLALRRLCKAQVHVHGRAKNVGDVWPLIWLRLNASADEPAKLREKRDVEELRLVWDYAESDVKGSSLVRDRLEGIGLRGN